ncbi:hypothetical protein LCL89_11695 [Halobacillus yeomjeoni]|uniref:hypothetical protein n=1 Tax=Halobacillus yeomjeoni TaxID=311194 RepID=UPI001CD48877|nr:hypothetical protein [Halobacillus yeomjeoni]MCA0984709.1 hypothetical protein [Halobacillus yeomjeoni]
MMIIRPEKEIGMGCCGGVCSDEDGLVHMEDEFKHHDEERMRLGEIYQRTLNEYGDRVDIIFLDPRNLLAILMYFVKQARKKQINKRTALKNILFHMKYGAIFINGRMTESFSDYERQLRIQIQE